MRVLMVVRQFYPWVGGTERQAQKLARALIAQGLDVKVVTGWWFRPTPQKEIIEGIPVYRNFTMWEMFGIRGLRKFSAYLYLITLLAYLWRHRYEYDVIHVHLLNYPAFAAVLAGKWFKKKTIIKIANSGSYSDLVLMQRNEFIPGTRQMLPTTLQADRFVALTPLIVEELQAAGVPAEKIVKIPNGVEVNGLTPKTDYRLHRPITLVFVGRLDTQKGLDILLPAFQQAKSARPELTWQLLLVGEGPLRSQLEIMAQELGIASQVIFCGQTDNVKSYLAQADIFILSSRAEGMSNALLEAMAYGLPCLVSGSGANSALVRHQENGLLVKGEKSCNWTEAIVSLVDDGYRREQLGRAAHQTIETSFTMEQVAKQYIELYQSLGPDMIPVRLEEKGWKF